MTGSQARGGPSEIDDEGSTDGTPDAGRAASTGSSSTASNPMLAMLSAMQSMSEATLSALTPSTFPAGVAQAGQIGQAQWQSMIEAMSIISQLPLANLDQAVREVTRLRKAISVMQLQLEGFDHQLAALEAVIRPLQQWAKAWRPKI